MSFGGVAVDHVGPTLRWPGASMLTGLIGNALGWDWSDRDVHVRLQQRIVSAAALIREGELLTDIQNAHMAKSDKGWSTIGRCEQRGGNSYKGPHRRRRDYLVDAELVVVLSLGLTNIEPSLDTLRSALLRPKRPLFIGRKSCLPAAPLVGETCPLIVAKDAHTALRQAAECTGALAWWPEDEGPPGASVFEAMDLRNWDTGFHGGSRRMTEGRL